MRVIRTDFSFFYVALNLFAKVKADMDEGWSTGERATMGNLTNASAFAEKAVEEYGNTEQWGVDGGDSKASNLEWFH